MQRCIDMITADPAYLARYERLRVLEVGSLHVNGSYRSIFDGLPVDLFRADLAAGDGVDLVLEDPYHIPLSDGSVDIVISGQIFEHCEFFWLAFAEMIRLVADDGFIVLIAPSAGPIHNCQVDCHRFYPDAYRALAKLTRSHLIYLRLDDRGP